MPLAFETLSHGRIAFGFFNIESDMLLLEHYFIFASDFCRNISESAGESAHTPYQREWQVYDIADRYLIGDLMGAMHGIRYIGFIGEVYRHFPFPEAPEDFKQKPEGNGTQTMMREIISKYGKPIPLTFRVDTERNTVNFGEYRFDRTYFQSLIHYVWVGGYPRWRDESPPSYVLEMRRCLDEKGNHLLGGPIQW